MTDQVHQERAGELDRLPKRYSGALAVRNGANLIARGLVDIELVEGEESVERGHEWLREEGPVAAAQRIRLAADQGDAEAQFNLGTMYENGRGVPQHDGEAVRWFHLAADQGNTEAQYQFGVRYAIGRGVPQDDREAARWYRLAAHQGDARAQVNVGRYADGQGVLRDDGEVVRWFRLAADQGNAKAQLQAGRHVRTWCGRAARLPRCAHVGESGRRTGRRGRAQVA